MIGCQPVRSFPLNSGSGAVHAAGRGALQERSAHARELKDCVSLLLCAGEFAAVGCQFPNQFRAGRHRGACTLRGAGRGRRRHRDYQTRSINLCRRDRMHVARALLHADLGSAVLLHDLHPTGESEFPAGGSDIPTAHERPAVFLRQRRNHHRGYRQSQYDAQSLHSMPAYPIFGVSGIESSYGARHRDSSFLPALVSSPSHRQLRGPQSHLPRPDRHQLGQRRRLGQRACHHLPRADRQGRLRVHHRRRLDARPGHWPAHRHLPLGGRGPHDPRPGGTGRGHAPPRRPLRRADPASRPPGRLAAQGPHLGHRPGGRAARLGRPRGRLRRGVRRRASRSAP